MKTPRIPRRATLPAALLLATALAGCVVAPAAPYYGDGMYADAPPPPPQSEVAPPPPAVGWIWIGGYWGWRAGRHVWIGGRWAAPRPGYRWVPYGWVPHGPRWRLEGGHWGR
jgi:hypothetical protein